MSAKQSAGLWLGRVSVLLLAAAPTIVVARAGQGPLLLALIPLTILALKGAEAWVKEQ